MFNIRNCFNICAKLYRLPIESCSIHKLIKHRQFSISATVSANTFTGTENAFAHDVLKSNAKCAVLRGEQDSEKNLKHANIDFEQNWNDLTPENMLAHLRLIGSYCQRNGITISDEKFDKFVDVCCDRRSDFNDDQLIKTLQVLMHHPPTDSANSRNFSELWNALDEACVERINGWDHDKILYVCDHWYMLNVGRFNRFNKIGSLKIGRRLRKLPPHQLVQIMFYTNIRRKPMLEMFDYEINLIQSIDQLSLNEIAVMCMGFFKTETKIKNLDLTSKIFERLIREIDTVEDIPLGCILKTLRYSANIAHVELIKSLLNAAADQIPRISVMCCLHLALLGTQVHICHEKCIENIVQRFSADVKSIRLKDFERIAFAVGLFNFESESKIENQLCQQILDELKHRVDDIVQYSRCFPLTLHFLTLKGYHDEELLNAVLSKKFLDFSYQSQYNYGKELFGLDSYVKINLKGTYKGNELTEGNRRYMGKMLTQYVPDREGKFKASAADVMLLELLKTSEELWTHCYFAHALPHFDRPDIIIAYDTITETGIDISRNLPPLYTGTIVDRAMLIDGLNVDTSRVEIINIVAGVMNSYNRDTERINGLTKQKLEQSQIVGFRPVLIPWYEWKRLLDFERPHYFKHKIKNTLQTKII